MSHQGARPATLLALVAFVLWWRAREPDSPPADLYVQMLPDGEPVRLTEDGTPKMTPAFSPDGARIA